MPYSIETPEPEPMPAKPMPAVQVAVYRGATAEESARKFEVDALRASEFGYEVLSQTWDASTLTTTYQRRRQELIPEPQVPAAGPEPSGASRATSSRRPITEVGHDPAPGQVDHAPISSRSASSVKTQDERQAILSAHVRMAVAHGGRVQSQDGVSAVIVYGKPVNHVLHAILTIFLLGLWLLVWIPMAMTGGERRELLTVDKSGNISTQRL